MDWPTDKIEELHQTVNEYMGMFPKQTPPVDHYEGEISAEIHRGLWIARCPEKYCSGAMAVTSLDKRIACPSCGAGWFVVQFPSNKLAIENELMKRPIPRGGMVHHNWAGETLVELRVEMKENA